MRLTDTIRTAFVRSVMDDVPRVDYEEQVRNLAMKTAIGLLPPKVRAVYQDEATRPFITTQYTYCRVSQYGSGINVTIPCPEDREMSERHIEKVHAAVMPLVQAHLDQEEARKVLATKLRGAAYGVNTRKALAELLPEFAKYLPADNAEANRSVPAIANLVSDFAKAGWPKGGEAAKSSRKVRAVA